MSESVYDYYLSICLSIFLSVSTDDLSPLLLALRAIPWLSPRLSDSASQYGERPAHVNKEYTHKLVLGVQKVHPVRMAAGKTNLLTFKNWHGFFDFL